MKKISLKSAKHPNKHRIRNYLPCVKYTIANPFIAQMERRKPKQVLRNAQGYALERTIKKELEEKYGQRAATVQADKLLRELPNKIPDLGERSFLDEAIKCFRAGAFRSSIVTTWNLTYYHLCDHILRNHLAAFNTQWPKSFQQKHKNACIPTVTRYDDFSELKESEVIQICRSANIINRNITKILKEKLDKRNMAAHPSSVVFVPHTAEEFIIDLITNVVLKLA